MNYKGYKELECYVQARLLNDEKEELKTGEEKCELVFKLVNGYISYLDKSKTKKSST